MHKIFLIFFITWFLSNTAFAYPNFIGKGYHACLTCHYNPFGNGPLNDYGRGVAASGIAGRLFISDKTSDEMLSNRSSFLFQKPDKNSIIKPALDYRGATLRRQLESDDPQEKYINMQMDASISAEWGKQKEYIASFTLSVVPSNSLPAGAKSYDVVAGEDLVFSKEHYFGLKLSQATRLYLGKMDKVFGIRVPDHTAYSRLRTGMTQYGSTHGAVFHFGKEKFDYGAHFYVGDLEKIPEDRKSGFSTKYEHSVTDNMRLGLSLLREKNDSDDTISSYAIHTKNGIGKGSSLMLEFGRIATQKVGSDPVTEQYIFLQNHFYIMRGLYFLATYEQYISDTSGASEEHRIAPGFQYFPMQRVEFRGELINSKNYTTNIATKDTWTYLGQIHLWF